VGHTAGQAAHRFHFLGLAKLGLQNLLLHLRLFVTRDIANDDDNADDHSL
jgi:hypothetical protein